MTNRSLTFNKEVYRLRLAITTNCILRCRYCFVRKNNKVISYPVAAKAINLFLRSPGEEKLLMIYGGEPLLYFTLLKNIIIFARKKANQLGKSLIISVGTNGILLTKTQLDFLRKTNTKLAISIDGQKKFHDKARVFPSGSGSFDYIFNKLPLIFEKTENENLCALVGVLPSVAVRMYENLIYLVKLGFKSINIEPIEHSRFKWNLDYQKAFVINMVNFSRFMFKNIHHGNFIFLNSVTREIKRRGLSNKKDICPFFRNLEIYPSGEMAFSPLLLNSEDKNQYVIGNVKKGLSEKYGKCVFSLNDKNCMNCWQNYLNDQNQTFWNSEKILKWRNEYSVYLCQKILTSAKKYPLFQKYIKEAKKRIFE
ncbi:MAG: 4Fe-4S cluster-binding domain-containing protein [Candidatus Omnitrophica bacterium]|nr:4Fe-4S cluster-binding domain-containing protein [Candidatus Omnitrophota bacterium]